MYEFIPVIFAVFLLTYGIINLLDDKYPEPILVYIVRGGRSVYKRLRGRWCIR